MPIIKNANLPNGIQYIVWEITESLAELEAIVSDEILLEDTLINITNPSKKTEFFASRLALKSLLESRDLPFYGLKKNSEGRPSLIQSDNQISMSHTQKLVAAAMHTTYKIGIDLEKSTPKLLRIKHKVFNKIELSDAGVDLEKLCLYWAAKEAIFKAYGKKQTSFKDHIFVSPFDLTDKRIFGRIQKINLIVEFELIVEQIRDYYLVFAQTKN